MKTNALNQCLNDINIIGSNQYSDVIIIRKEFTHKLLSLYGLQPKDITKYIMMGTISNYYIRKQKTYAPVGTFLSTIIKLAKHRLPAYIYNIVENVSVVISKKMTINNGQWYKGRITLSDNYIKEYMQQPDYNLDNLLHTIGHEYWHAYSEITNNYKQQNSIVNYINFLDTLTDDLQNNVEKYYVAKWGRNYINKIATYYLYKKRYNKIDKHIIRGSFEEIMADSLGCVVAGTKNNITNKGINFILNGGR